MLNIYNLMYQMTLILNFIHIFAEYVKLLIFKTIIMKNFVMKSLLAGLFCMFTNLSFAQNSVDSGPKYYVDLTKTTGLMVMSNPATTLYSLPLIGTSPSPLVVKHDFTDGFDFEFLLRVAGTTGAAITGSYWTLYFSAAGEQDQKSFVNFKEVFQKAGITCDNSVYHRVRVQIVGQKCIFTINGRSYIKSRCS